MVGGEACSGELVAQWSQGRRMFNGYGPTETTVVVTMAGPLSGGGAPPIGPPAYNTRVYVLDESLRPAPAGGPGGVYVAGGGPAAGSPRPPGFTGGGVVYSPPGAPGAA